MAGKFRTPGTSSAVAARETGGPLVDLSGQVIGIDVAGAGSGLHNIGYAVPINQALSIARRIDHRARTIHHGGRHGTAPVPARRPA